MWWNFPHFIILIHTLCPRMRAHSPHNAVFLRNILQPSQDNLIGQILALRHQRPPRWCGGGRHSSRTFYNLIRSADVCMFWGEENLPKLNISFSLHLVSCVQKVITNTLVPQAMSKKCDRGRQMSRENLLLVYMEWVKLLFIGFSVSSS